MRAWVGHITLRVMLARKVPAFFRRNAIESQYKTAQYVHTALRWFGVAYGTSFEHRKFIMIILEKIVNLSSGCNMLYLHWHHFRHISSLRKDVLSTHGKLINNLYHYDSICHICCEFTLLATRYLYKGFPSHLNYGWRPGAVHSEMNPAIDGITGKLLQRTAWVVNSDTAYR